MKILRSHRGLQHLILAALLPLLALMPVSANPKKGQVKVGDVTINEATGGTLKIDQHSQRAVIEWDEFSIETDELTQFFQPGTDAAVLNRVLGGNISSINGALKANGNVWIINQNGVVFGPGANVDVFGLVASTLDVTDDDFMNAGDMQFTGGTGDVINFGRINAAGGDVYLVGRNVENAGVIGAVDGNVGLAAGNSVVIKAFGKERVFVSAGEGSVTNTGEIRSAMAELKAHGNVGALAINSPGFIRVDGTKTVNGRIYLSSTNGNILSTGSLVAKNDDGSGGEIILTTGMGEIEVGGILDASGSAGIGGSISLLGETVNVNPATIMNANGTEGGSIRIGTNPDAGHVHILPGAQITANGTVGNGGEIHVAGAEVIAMGDSTLGAVGEQAGGNINITSTGLVMIEGNLDASGRGAVGNGGRVTLSGENVLVNQTGAVRADGKQNGGDVRVSAVDQIYVAGQITALGEQGTGGRIRMVAEDILIPQSGRVDASGANGGVVALSASDEIFIAGEVAARGTDGSGGFIGLSATDIMVAGSGLVDASGTDGGGFININAAETATVMGRVLATGGDGAGGTININGTDVFIGPQARVDASGATGGTINLSAANEMMIQGDVRAIGNSGAGGNINVSGRDVFITPTANIDASGTTGGNINLDAAREMNVNGTVRSVGSDGSGGNINITGEEVNIGPEADIDASGATGGNVNIGGGFQGKDASLRNSERTSVAAGAVISANGTSGQGGRIAFWSDGATDFRGNANAFGSGQNSGGVVEVSGLRDLSFTGNVNTGGGLLLLDPVNVLVGSAGLTEGNLATALASNNVLIHTADAASSDDGNIEIMKNFSLVYKSDYDLSFFAHNDISVVSGGSDGSDPGSPGRGGVNSNNGDLGAQIVNEGSGNINLVAGWNGNGLTFANGTDPVNVGANVQSASSGTINAIDSAFIDSNITYGEGGDIHINPNRDGVTEIGSARGETNLYANNINIFSGNSNENTQIGYAVRHLNAAGANNPTLDGVNPDAIDGDIHIKAKGNVIVDTHPTGHRSMIHIGHGGDRDGQTILQNGLQSGAPTAGTNQTGTLYDGLSGDVIVTAGGTLFTNAGDHEAFVQYGHGGWGLDGNMGKDTDVIYLEGTSVIFDQQRVGINNSFIKVGNGGTQVRGSHSAARIDVIATAGAIVSNGTNQNEVTGTTSRGSENHYFHIGNGGWDAGYTTGSDANLDLVHSGIINVEATGPITILAGIGDKNFAQIGHGGFRTGGQYNGDVTVRSTSGNVTLGHQTIPATNLIGGAINAELGRQSHVQVGHGSNSENNNTRDRFSGATGDIVVSANGIISLSGNDSKHESGKGYGMIGHGGYDAGSNQAHGTISGSITVDAGFGVNVKAGLGEASFAQIGHGGIGLDSGTGFTGMTIGDSADLTDSAISVTTTQGDISVIGATARLEDRRGTGIYQNRRFAMIGHGGLANDGNFHGDVTVRADAGNISVLGGVESEDFAKIGHGGQRIQDGGTAGGTRYVQEGTITVDAGNKITVQAGDDSGAGFDNYAQIGHGGSGRSNAGDVDAGNRPFSLLGDVLINQNIRGTGGIDVLAGDSAIGTSFASIGHVSSQMHRNNGNLLLHQGNIALATDGDINIKGGAGGNDNFAAVGHGANIVRSVVEVDGSVTVDTGGALNLEAGAANSGTRNYAQLGHFAVGPVVDLTTSAASDITVHAVGDISLNGAAGSAGHAMIGHGGNVTGNPNSDATPIVDLAGNVEVLSGGNITIQGGNRVSLNDDPAGFLTFLNNATNGSNFVAGAHGTDAVSGTSADFAVAGTDLMGNAFTSRFRIADIDAGIGGFFAAATTAGVGQVAGDAGLLETVLTGQNRGNPFALTADRHSVTSNVAAGEVAGGAAAGDPWVIPTSATPTDNITVSYEGQFFDADGIIAFGENIDDQTRVTLASATGTHVLVDNATWNAPTTNAGGGTVDIGASVNGDGWYDIVVTMVEGGGGAGPVNQNGWAADRGFGLIDPSATADTLADASGAFAQIGHGGAGMNSTASNIAGNLDVRAAQDITFTTGTGSNSYAKIGLGDHLDNTPAFSGFRDGDVSVAAGQDLTMTGGMIGHAGDLAEAIVSGNTYIAVGRSGTGNLTINPDADLNPAVLSSSLGEQLRIYMDDRTPAGGDIAGAVNNNFISNGTMLNGQAYDSPVNGTTIEPALRGSDERSAVEFSFTTANGLPQGRFSPVGDYVGPYTIYYSGGRTPGGGGGGDAPAVIPPSGGGSSDAPLIIPRNRQVLEVPPVVITPLPDPLSFTGDSKFESSDRVESDIEPGPFTQDSRPSPGSGAKGNFSVEFMAGPNGNGFGRVVDASGNEVPMPVNTSGDDPYAIPNAANGTIPLPEATGSGVNTDEDEGVEDEFDAFGSDPEPAADDDIFGGAGMTDDPF